MAIDPDEALRLTEQDLVFVEWWESAIDAQLPTVYVDEHSVRLAFGPEFRDPGERTERVEKELERRYRAAGWASLRMGYEIHDRILRNRTGRMLVDLVRLPKA